MQSNYCVREKLHVFQAIYRLAKRNCVISFNITGDAAQSFRVDERCAVYCVRTFTFHSNK